MTHTIEQVVAFLKKSTDHRGIRAVKPPKAKPRVGRIDSEVSPEDQFEPIEDQLAPFQYIGNIFKH